MQVEGACQRLCQSLGGEVHCLALQVQVLEESDTHAIEAEAVSVQCLVNASSCCVWRLTGIAALLLFWFGFDCPSTCWHTQSFLCTYLQATYRSSQHAPPWMSAPEGVSGISVPLATGESLMPC